MGENKNPVLFSLQYMGIPPSGSSEMNFTTIPLLHSIHGHQKAISLRACTRLINPKRQKKKKLHTGRRNHSKDACQALSTCRILERKIKRPVLDVKKYSIFKVTFCAVCIQTKGALCCFPAALDV